MNECAVARRGTRITFSPRAVLDDEKSCTHYYCWLARARIGSFIIPSKPPTPNAGVLCIPVTDGKVN